MAGLPEPVFFFTVLQRRHTGIFSEYPAEIAGRLKTAACADFFYCIPACGESVSGCLNAQREKIIYRGCQKAGLKAAGSLALLMPADAAISARVIREEQLL